MTSTLTDTARRPGGPTDPGLSGRDTTAAGQPGTSPVTEAVLMACVLARHGSAPKLGVNADLDYVTLLLTTHMVGAHEPMLHWRNHVPGGEFAWRHQWNAARSTVRRLYAQLPSAAAEVFPHYDDAVQTVFPPVGETSTLPG